MEPVLTLAQQVELLDSFGLKIDDHHAAEKYLYDTNYYRLNGYARQFQYDPQNGDNRFEEGCSLGRIQDIIAKDTRLSMELFRCLTLVEKTVKARLAYNLGQVAGNEAFYLDSSNYVSVTGIEDFPGRLEEELRRSQTPAISRYMNNDGDLSKVPIWVAIELFSFGSVSKILEYYIYRGPRDAVAASFSEQKQTFPSTIHSLSVLRNRCAHHGQIWHRRMGIMTPVKRKEHRHAPTFDPQGIYPAILALRRLLKSIDEGSEYIKGLFDCIENNDLVFINGLLYPAPH